MKTVLFACDQNAGRSQIAAALFNAMADPTKARATSATDPASAVHPEVVRVLAEEHLDAHLEMPKPLTQDLVGRASVLITMRCGAQFPEIPGITREDWPLDDPPTADVRQLREVIRAWVGDLIARHGWGRA